MFTEDISKQEVFEEYAKACTEANRKLTRQEYRNLNTKYSTSLIEKLFGSWSNFAERMESFTTPNRYTIHCEIPENVEKVVITHAYDGMNIDQTFLNTLKNYCDINKAQLKVLWGRNVGKRSSFDEETYKILSPYLVTDITFAKDMSCLAKDFMISPSHKNPLLNIERISSHYKTLVLGDAKQYLRILPYKNYDVYKVACTTGTLSNISYADTIPGRNDKQNHTFGAILLTWNKEQKRYVVRNLTYINEELIDLDEVYTPNSFEKLKNIPAMVCGDLHLPEEDKDAIKKTQEQIKALKPSDVILHDVASWNSISHHEANKFLSRVKNRTEENVTLETEFKAVCDHLKSFTEPFNKTSFHIVNSNHDKFINKWLEKGEFIKDTSNAVFGAKLFIDYSKNDNIFTGHLPKNISFMNKDESFNVHGYELSEHGDCGICGMKGNILSFNKGFSKIIIGHTHSSEITEHTIVVGTLSKLKLNYNQEGLTKWVHCNAIIHRNGSFQLLFI